MWLYWYHHRYSKLKTKHLIEKEKVEQGKTPDIIHVDGTVFAIAYAGDGDDGFLQTVEISTDGTITNAAIDTLKFDTVSGKTPYIIHISGDVCAIAYSGAKDHGLLKTVEISCYYRGVVKADAYRIGADNTTAFAAINKKTFSAPITPGIFNHIVLTYDKDATSNQMKLYVNGAIQAQENLSEEININTNPFVIGKYFKGIIDEVIVYSYALSGDWVLQRYNALKP